MATVVQQEVHGKKLYGSKCFRCGYVSFPAQAICPRCGPFRSTEVKTFELPERGTVVTWTQLKVAPKGFPSPLSHCVLDLGCVKIVGTIQGCPDTRKDEKLIIVEDQSAKFPYAFAHPVTKMASP
jgi:uncharacterized OB-fold protein